MGLVGADRRHVSSDPSSGRACSPPPLREMENLGILETTPGVSVEPLKEELPRHPFWVRWTYWVMTRIVPVLRSIVPSAVGSEGRAPASLKCFSICRALCRALCCALQSALLHFGLDPPQGSKLLNGTTGCAELRRRVAGRKR